jgi:hypothetical protein
MLYQNPYLEIVVFETEDVICASIGGDHDPDNPGGDQSGAGGSWAQP